MAVPSSATYSVAAKVAAHQALVDLIDGGSVEGYIAIMDASDVVLSTIPLDDPCGTVAAETGLLTFSIAGSEVPPTEGTAAYGEFRDSNHNAHLALPAQSGGSPVSGYIVLNTLTIVADAEITISSATVG